MRLRLLLGLGACLGLAAVAQSNPSHAGGEVNILVLKENGVGSAAQAQPFVDKFVVIAQKKLGWAAAKGTYHTERKSAEAYIDASKPQYGFLSLGAFLALEAPRKLEVVGQATVSRAGGQQYFLVSKTASDLAGCKGGKLATNHADDPKFVERVVFAGAAKLSDFKLEEARRPLQGMKKVINGEAVCALIDDAQLAELPNIDGGKDLKTAWKSAALPPMVVVAFPSASDKAAFKGALGSLCEGDAKTVCGEIGIQSLKPASSDAYAQVLAAYKKDK